MASWRWLVGSWFLLLGLGAMGVSAGEQVIAITDYTGRGFAPDLVQYRIAQDVDAKKLSLSDVQGQPVPMQIGKSADGGAVLSFIASVEHDATATYKLSSAASTAKGSVAVEQKADCLVLRNDRLSIIMPPVQDKAFDNPVAASTLSAPIQKWSSRGGSPMGAAKILTDRLVKHLRVAVVEEGDVFSDAVYELEWAEGGFYRCTVRVMHQVPLAKITEEFDLGKLDGGDFWELNLLDGWQPDTMEIARPWGNGSTAYAGDIVGMDFISADITKNSRPFFPMSADNASLCHIGLSQAEAMRSSPATAPMAGVVLLHKGDWRRMNVLEVYSDKAGDLRIRLPMSVRNVSWKKDVASVTSPFSMHSFDATLPATYGRRIWGLALAAEELAKADEAFAAALGSPKFSAMKPFAKLRSLYGVVSLDRYKDYVLDWNDSGLKYPRVWRAGMAPGQQREAFSRAALPDDLKKKMGEQFASFADPQKREAVLKSEWEKTLKQLVFFANYFVNCPAPSHHVVGGSFAGAQLADDLLAQPDISPEQRKGLRARLALLMYLFLEPDVMNFLSGQHPGNPNMGMARSFPGFAYAPLLADHPMYERWRARAAEHVEYMLSSSMAPGGGWFEFGAAYHMHGFRVRHTIQALITMELPNLDLLLDYCKQDMAYFMNLLTPADKRYGTRMIPGMANSSPGQCGSFLETAAGYEQKDPAFAQAMLGAWQENGLGSEDYGNVPLALQGKTPELKSGQYPGFGVIFRAHQGQDETYMLLRNGFLWSHWYIDPGHFIMYSRGVPLVPQQPYQYYTSPNADFDMYNTIRFGDAKNKMPYGWPDSNILDSAFGGSVEYAWSSTGVTDWFINPGAAPGFIEKVANIPNPDQRTLDSAFKQSEGAFEWDRQVFFMKGEKSDSPNYFVFRDTVKGEGKLSSYLNLNLLGRKGDLSFEKSVVKANTEFSTKLDLLFPDRQEIKADLLEEFHQPQLIGTALHGKLDPKAQPLSKNWVDPATGQPSNDQGKLREQHVFLRIPGEPGKGYFWALWPRDEKEAAPEASMPDPNVVKIKHREGTDYIFCAADPIKCTVDNITFSGKAGAVRLRSDHAVLSILSGQGSVAIGKQSLSGIGPLERKVPLTGEKAEVVPAAKSSIAIPEKAPDGWAMQAHGSGKAAVSKDSIYMDGGAGAILSKGDEVRFVAPAGEYVKLSLGNVGVRGFGPFDLTFTPTGITGSMEGKMRTIVATWPEKLTRPMYRQDGRRWYAGWADDPSISKGTKTPQFALAFAVFDGQHKVEVSEWTFPTQPPLPQRKEVTLP